MLIQRLATAAVALPILLVLVLVGGAPFAIVLALAIGVAALETAAAAGLAWRRPEVLLSAALAAAIVPAIYANADLLGGLLVAVVAVPLLASVWRAEVASERGLPAALVLPAVALYTGWLGHYFLLVRRLGNGDRWTLVLLLGTFATDTGAYAVGRLLGRHKLAPRISPSKTVEGAIGGLLAAAIAVPALCAVLDLQRRPVLTLLLGLLLGISAQAGDLAESALKRRLGVKDMGRMFPGHGGLMDRLDSLLFVAPVVYFVVRWTIIR